MKKIIVIVPAYCEENTIHTTIYALNNIKPQLIDKGFHLSVYVINDGSIDATGENAENAGADRVLHHRVNQGLGSAVRTGLEAAKRDGADIAVKFDADLQHDPEDILSLIDPILGDEAEIVYGNRLEKINYKMPLIRRIGNKTFTGLMRWMTSWPVVDSQPGIFAVSSDYLAVSYIPGDYNYSQQILLDAFHKGMRFAQVPVTFNERTTGSSFVSFKYPFKVLPQILQVLVGVKPLKVFGPIALFFLTMGTVVAFLNLYGWLSGDAEKPIQQVNLVLGSGLFGLQTLFFGLLADLIVKQNISKN
jgi:glycosyltransferase involved in cell wall biosynthesis